MILWQNHHSRARKHIPTVCALLLSWTLEAAAEPSSNQPDGGQLVAAAARSLLQSPSIEARIRQRIDLFGNRLVGTGVYRHQGVGANKRVRLEMKVQVGDQLTSLQQVSDGRHLWIRRDFPGMQSLVRVDLRRVREAVARSGQVPLVESAAAWTALGGIGRLLDGLEKNFQFGPGREANLGAEPVWVVEGEWRNERLSQLLSRRDGPSAAKISPDDLPPHLPQRVRLVLDRGNALPLFPYRVQFLRKQSEPGGEEQGTAEFKPILTLELFEVRTGVHFDPALFRYQAGDQDVADHTQIFLTHLGVSE